VCVCWCVCVLVCCHYDHVGLIRQTFVAIMGRIASSSQVDWNDADLRTRFSSFSKLDVLLYPMVYVVFVLISCDCRSRRRRRRRRQYWYYYYHYYYWYRKYCTFLLHLLVRHHLVVLVAVVVAVC
jgi:hypothetical protein